MFNGELQQNIYGKYIIVKSIGMQTGWIIDCYNFAFQASATFKKASYQ